eukprot:TRINITY_DN37482_c0_g1_i1.p2 TRINITY_DN37482_c0_g1~~TRINITY_DN37482_c0_g1_i1.p2  ORF type:complete len:159 (+),score=36.67 TRINITY_DN37482_c0_g1_i1:63-539(+)
MAGPIPRGLALLLSAGDGPVPALQALATPRQPAGAHLRVCSAAEVRAARAGLRCRVGDLRVPVGIFALPDGTFAAVHNSCPHSSMSLSDGDVEAAKCLIRCRGHGYGFNLRTGLCDVEDLVAPVFDCQLRGDDLWVDVTQTVNKARCYDPRTGKIQYD